MNASSERVKTQRAIFILASVMLFAILFVTHCPSVTTEPEDAVVETALTEGVVTSGSDTESDSDADTEPPAPKPLTEEEKDAFWDESVFIGDSVTLGLRNYVVGQRNKGAKCLSGAQFLAVGNMGYMNSLSEIGARNSYHPKFQGKEVTIEEGVRLTGAKRVFIMLGMNDFCAYPTETGIEGAKEVVNRILNKCPDADIYIESVTPGLYDRKKFNNENINIFDDALKKMCEENGWTYVDVASVMKDADGKLKKEYCSDPEAEGVHMSSDGCVAWIGYLNEFITYGGKNQ